MAKEYNKSVRELFGLHPVNGEVGIEIEAEGKNLIHERILPYWGWHIDHSLRGQDNAEYILRNPVDRKEVLPALQSLFTALDKNEAVLRKHSPNASIHVHLNVQEWSLRQAYVLMCLWYMFEETLMDWCGEQRVGNLFCLRGCDAELQLLRLASAIRYGRYRDLNDPDGLRYAALNYTALGKFGSLEFRGFPPIYDVELIDTWVKALLCLKDFSEKYKTPPELMVEFSRSGPEDFFKMVLEKDKLWKVFETRNYPEQLKNGMRLIQNVAYCVNWDAKQDVPVKPKKKEPDPLEDWAENGEPDEDVEEDEDEDIHNRPRRMDEPPQARDIIRDMARAERERRMLDNLVPHLNVRQPENPLGNPWNHIIVDQNGVERANGETWRNHNNQLFRNRDGFIEQWDLEALVWR